MTGSGLLYIQSNLLESINLSNVLTSTAINGPRGIAAANNCKNKWGMLTYYLLMHWKFPMMFIQHSVNADWLFNTQSRVLHADWLMLVNNEKATLNIRMKTSHMTCYIVTKKPVNLQLVHQERGSFKIHTIQIIIQNGHMISCSQLSNVRLWFRSCVDIEGWQLQELTMRWYINWLQSQNMFELEQLGKFNQGVIYSITPWFNTFPFPFPGSLLGKAIVRTRKEFQFKKCYNSIICQSRLTVPLYLRKQDLPYYSL